MQGIISDLFPGVTRPTLDYGALQGALAEAARELNIQPIPTLLDKCIQL